jgi:hypothetical protein
MAIHKTYVLDFCEATLHHPSNSWYIREALKGKGVWKKLGRLLGNRQTSEKQTTPQANGTLRAMQVVRKQTIP